MVSAFLFCALLPATLRDIEVIGHETQIKDREVIMSQEAQLKVFYDGGCPVCRREISYFRGRDGAETIDWIDLTTVPDASLPDALDRQTALARFHVQGGDGSLHSGSAAFVKMWQRFSGFSLLARIFNHRIGIWFLDKVYAVILRIRPSIQKLFAE